MMIQINVDKTSAKRGNGESFTKFREVRRRTRQIADDSKKAQKWKKSGEPPPLIVDLTTDVIASNNSNSRVTAEWDSNTNGGTAEVIVRVHGKPTVITSNTTFIYEGLPPVGSGVTVRTEEALIVIIVLLLWVAAIALFFNRWGKIRMLEPYQPKFQQEEDQHRKSCPLPEAPPHLHHRSSMSRAFGTCNECGYGSQTYSFQPIAHHSNLSRTRQNSVFMGSTNTMTLIPESPARRSRSVADLPTLSESPSTMGSPTHYHHSFQTPVDINTYVNVSTVTDV